MRNLLHGGDLDLHRAQPFGHELPRPRPPAHPLELGLLEHLDGILFPVVAAAGQEDCLESPLQSWLGPLSAAKDPRAQPTWHATS